MSVLIRQLFERESSTYTYILIDKVSKEAMIIDPVRETLDRDLELLEELKVKLKYIAETHVHADHITSAGVLRERTGGQIVIGKASQLETADKLLEDGEEIHLGQSAIKVILTPGHTDGCTSYYIDSYLFTGDALLIRGCGRTDFQQGSNEVLFHSIREKLFKLPDETQVYPGHDYKGRMSSTLGEEKEFNPRLNLAKSEAEFVQIMKGLKLALPKKIDIAVPANLKSGLE